MRYHKFASRGRRTSHGRQIYPGGVGKEDGRRIAAATNNATRLMGRLFVEHVKFWDGQGTTTSTFAARYAMGYLGSASGADNNELNCASLASKT